MIRLHFISRAHRGLVDYLRPKNGADGPKEHELVGRFATLLGLASIFVPFFVIEFMITGYDKAAVVMLLTGGTMVLSAFVFRLTGSIGVAREAFQLSLFGFLAWELYYFGTIYSPGSVWFVALPVVSILLGSVRTAIFWVVAGVGVLSSSYYSSFNAGEWVGPPAGKFSALYVASLTAMILAIFLFVLMVDSARVQAIRKLAAANDANRYLAERDDLTELLNRRSFQVKLAELLSRVSDRSVVVLFADLDGFKDINDTYGHNIGDKVICHVAAFLRGLCREDGVVLARLGGDEFAIAIAGHDAEDAARGLATEALKLTGQSIEILGKEMLVGMSIGLASAEGQIDASELMRRADLAMYEAKEQGGASLCAFTASMDTARSKRVIMGAELAQALHSRRIDVQYQPIVDSSRFTISGVEALARWTSSRGESIPPDVFIPIAEESGLITRLGLYVLEASCAEALYWPTLTLSVNLSPVQFRSPTLVQDIVAVLGRASFPAERLELEVTEGYLIEHPERALPIIAALRGKGIRVALDDFGSGYSSIGYLRQYPFDRLKIDKSIVKGLGRDPASQSIVQATALLAKSLSLRVTAEGVETSEQATMLRLVGCDDLQGYHFSRPVPAKEISEMVNRLGLSEFASEPQTRETGKFFS